MKYKNMFLFSILLPSLVLSSPAFAVSFPYVTTWKAVKYECLNGQKMNPRVPKIEQYVLTFGVTDNFQLSKIADNGDVVSIDGVVHRVDKNGFYLKYSNVISNVGSVLRSPSLDSYHVVLSSSDNEFSWTESSRACPAPDLHWGSNIKVTFERYIKI